MVPIYLKTTYSFLSSLITINDLINFANKNKLSSLVICDNNLFGAMNFIRDCQKNNIKPIIGLDINNILLYSKNYTGYQNLLKLVSLSETKNISHDDLLKYSSDLICVIPYQNSKLYDDLKNVYKDLYIGVSNNDEYNNSLNNVKKIYLRKILSLNKDDLDTLKCLHMLRDNKTFSDDYEFDINVYYTDKICINKECLDNTLELINNCNLILPKYKLNLPSYGDYNNIKNLSSDEYLYNLSVKGLNKRLNNNVNDIYMKRLLYELDVIKKMGFSDYFLIVYDYIKYAKNNNILVGPGRGSGASSLVSYSLGITEVDPIKYNLLFERFLNIERITMPDIDTDFPDNRRDEVINYVVNKYSLKHVSGIITFGTFGSKMALRDMGRVMNIPLYMIDDICKIIGNSFDSLEKIYEKNLKIKGLIDSDNNLKKLYKNAKRIEGLIRHTSVHAAGIILSKTELDEIVPLYYKDNMYLSGYEACYLEDLGLIKMDFLGLKNLTTIDNIINSINEDGKENISFNTISLDDNMTNDVFKTGNTLGIFQFESVGMRKFLMKLKPNSFMDIVNANAFFRPGPSDYIDSFIKRRENIEKEDYFDIRLQNILKDTRGIIVYQEQIMMIANIMASYTLGEADILRRAMSKKKLDVLKGEKEKFIEGSLKNNFSLELSERIYEMILNFASYGFNKSHSVAYSMISYKMAYLKAHYQQYFYISLLNSVTFDLSKTYEYIKEIKKLKIGILKPDINLSTYKYLIYDNKILLPFNLVNGISSLMAKKIVEIRSSAFNDIYDLFSKLISNDINKNIIIALIDSGSLDSFGYTRKTLYHNIDSLINYGELTKDINPSYVLKPDMVLLDEFDKRILINKEKECFGFYLSNHPVSLCKINDNAINLIDVDKYFNKTIKTIVMIDKIKEITTKKGDKMCFLNASDEESSMEYILFPKVYKMYQDLKKSDIIKVVGKVERESSYKIIVDKVDKLEV